MFLKLMIKSVTPVLKELGYCMKFHRTDFDDLQILQTLFLDEKVQRQH